MSFCKLKIMLPTAGARTEAVTGSDVILSKQFGGREEKFRRFSLLCFLKSFAYINPLKLALANARRAATAPNELL
jgi:hypothetical protein